jgi:pimeloyl-ACP methyl ester carboxylesterase
MERGQTPRRSMWAYVHYELGRSSWVTAYPDYPSLLADTLELIDFSHGHWRRLEGVRVPVLVLQAADDPVEGSAQAAAELFAPLGNPNCAMIILRHGGHAGFSAAVTAYEYNLLRAFFDPRTAPRAQTVASVAHDELTRAVTR